MLKDNRNTMKIGTSALVAAMLSLVLNSAFGSSNDIDYLLLSLEELIDMKGVTAGKQRQKNTDKNASTVLITRNKNASTG